MSRFAGYKEDPDVRTFDIGHVRRLWPFVRPYRFAFAVCIVILGVSFALELVKPWLVRQLLDGPVVDALRGGDVASSAVLVLGLAFLGTTVGGVLLGYAYAILTARNGQRVIRDVRTALFSHVLSLGPRFFDRNPAGKLVTRITSDVENLNELIATGVLQALFDLLKIVGVLVALFVLSPALAWFTVLTTPAILVLSLLFRGLFRRAFRRVRGRIARQNAFTAEAIGGLRITRMFGQEAVVQEHYHELNDDTRRAWTDTVFQFALFQSLVDLAIVLTQAGILWFGGTRLLAGELTVGQFTQFWLYFPMITGPIREISEKYNVLQSAFASCERIFGIFDEKPFPPPRGEVAGTATAAPTAAATRRGPAHVRFEDVAFRYLPEKPVLAGITFEIPPGKTVALVGPTGAGKSTVLGLLSRLMDPDAGRVTIDGVDLRELDVDALRRRIAVVPQDVFLFTGSVLDNVRLFDASIDEDRVARALAAVGADFVQRLPGGVHAPVEERGATFSQGERQLLSFARALAAEPDLLVLDEATANIDSESEERIQKALRTLLRGRSALVVAHRLSTVRDADAILVLEKGRVVEAGTHDALLRAQGAYARMVRGLAAE